MVEAENTAFQSELEVEDKVQTVGAFPTQSHTCPDAHSRPHAIASAVVVCSKRSRRSRRPGKN